MSEKISKTSSKNNQESKKIYVLDANVFINNLSYLFNDSFIVTTPYIEEEMKSSRSKMDFYRASLMNLHILMPKKEYLDEVDKEVSITKHKLSFADKSIIALALELKNKNKEVILVSDDYSIQDIALRLNISILSITKPKIRDKYEWKRLCISCNRETTSEICEVCGSETKYIRKK